ncbi:MAG: PIN domain-containing protein [Gemmatimonadales bacterium]|nr:PIN domain-containing protein [Gemmatimonadales bacterium]
MIVLDASAVIELLLNTKAGQRVAEAITPPEVSLHAPHLLDVEVALALRRYVQARTISTDRAELALEHLGQLGVTRHGHEELLPRIWALRDNLTAYDAAYVVLAEALAAPLLTLDTRLAEAPGHQARVWMVGDG